MQTPLEKASGSASAQGVLCTGNWRLRNLFLYLAGSMRVLLLLAIGAAGRMVRPMPRRPQSILKGLKGAETLHLTMSSVSFCLRFRFRLSIPPILIAALAIYLGDGPRSSGMNFHPARW